MAEHSLTTSMLKLVGQLRRGSHTMRSDTSAYIQSPQFETAIKEINNDENAKALLMIELLKHISLDPNTGRNTEAFVTIGLEKILFRIRLNRFVNFIGHITLNKSNSTTVKLIAAIESNLNSRMFKAAAMHRRLDQRRLRLISQNIRLAHATWQQFILSQGNDLTYEERKAQASNIYDQVYDKRERVINTRVLKVSQCSYSNEFSGGYTQAVSDFLYSYLTRN